MSDWTVDFHDELHCLSESQLAQLGVLNGEGSLLIHQKEVGIVSFEVVGPQELESLQGPQAKCEVFGGREDESMVAGGHNFFHWFCVVYAIVDHDIFCSVSGDGGQGQSPDFEVAVVESCNSVLVGFIEMNVGDGSFLFDQLDDAGLEFEFAEGVEVDVLGGPDVEEVLPLIVPVPLVPTQSVLLLHTSQFCPLDPEPDARQELRLLQVGLDAHLHHLHLNHSDQQERSQLLDILESYRVLALPVHQPTDQIQVTVENVQFPVAAEDHEGVPLVRVSAVNYGLLGPGDGFAAVVQTVAVEDDEWVPEVNGGSFNAEGLERGID